MELLSIQEIERLTRKRWVGFFHGQDPPFFLRQYFLPPGTFELSFGVTSQRRPSKTIVFFFSRQASSRRTTSEEEPTVKFPCTAPTSTNLQRRKHKTCRNLNCLLAVDTLVFQPRYRRSNTIDPKQIIHSFRHIIHSSAC